MDGLPTPPNEDFLGHKRHHTISKSVKAVHRTSKRTSYHGHPPSPVHDTHSSHSGDARHKRVWKACERCRMKKTKCDGEFPCKRCKDDGLVCTAGVRKKTEYKQLPRGYAEVLENTQFALIATVHKLYAMVRNHQTWDLGEPDLNDRGQPVIHNIASKLGCIRPSGDMDLPPHAVFPEDEAGLTELARQLEEQQRREAIAAPLSSNGTTTSIPHSHHSRQNTIDSRTDDRASSSSPELDHSDFETSMDNYRKATFGTTTGATSAITMSPASLSYRDFDMSGCPTPSVDGRFPPHTTQSPTSAVSIPTSLNWLNAARTSSTAVMDALEFTSQPAAHYGGYTLDMDMLNQNLLESAFGVGSGVGMKGLACAANPDVTLLGGMGDTMMYGGVYGGDDGLRM
ncbi:Fluconazole resistance protein 1 [Podospora bellae-mahoneyi]|uniref:Fluconazole resistance protein 1 n=1 Tax=Podospora bellae-mahoneyi TaxID=2093777 RepID=A0ABR0G0N0_9PEZI|nr:Fluconazole resistance protein 1 [Podospora bellae-mahoneyi]